MVYLSMPRPEFNTQLSLFSGHDERFITEYFRKKTGKPVSLILTDNSTSILSARIKSGVVHIRFHRMLLNAGIDIIAEIAEFIKAKSRRTPLLREFIKKNSTCLRNKPPRAVHAVLQGRYHNLGHLYEAINRDYFEGRVTASITWGARGTKRAARRRTLGSYSVHTNTIRINPVLDKRTVPLYFVEFIIYHEMLHAAIGVGKKAGRNIVHSQEFKRRERLFRDYEKATVWERANL
ncbi:MAG: SprT-like domain-containing protein [Nitrospirae bacterium]|nr:SprT-like domain-containing protein [Nitrospirota bacterium]